MLKVLGSNPIPTSLFIGIETQTTSVLVELERGYLQKNYLQLFRQTNILIFKNYSISKKIIYFCQTNHGSTVIRLPDRIVEGEKNLKPNWYLCVQKCTFQATQVIL